MIYCAVMEIGVLAQPAFAAPSLGASVPNIRLADSKWKASFSF
jgi:hypothetical protein